MSYVPVQSSGERRIRTPAGRGKIESSARAISMADDALLLRVNRALALFPRVV